MHRLDHSSLSELRMPPEEPESAQSPLTWTFRLSVFAAILVIVALVPRIWLALNTVYLWDEDRDWIPLAKSISFNSDALNLPLRGYHPALAAYGIALGRALLGPSEIGSRVVGVVLGALTVLIIFDLARRWASQTAAIGAASLLALNEYHVQVSALATEKVYYLFFATLALWAFARFLMEERAAWLYWTAGASACSFLSKELAILLLPAFLMSLVLTERRVWLRRREPYLAALLFWLLILPDLWWNAVHRTGEAGIDYGMSLSRIHGVHVTYKSLELYLEGPIKWMSAQLGRPFESEVTEYATSNVAFGSLLLLAVLTTVLRPPSSNRSLTKALLILFAFVLLFFTLLDTQPSHNLDPFAFFWVDLTLLPAVIVAGAVLADGRPIRRLLNWGLFSVGVALSLAGTLRDHLGMPAYQLAAYPPALLVSRDSVYSVRIAINACMRCDERAITRLDRVQFCGETEADQRGVVTEQSGSPSRGADISRMLVLAGTTRLAGEKRWYCATYSVNPKEGAVREVTVAIPVLMVDDPPITGADPRVKFPAVSW